MARSTTTFATGLLLIIAPADAALAQGVTLTPFAAVNHGLEAAPRLVGLSATAWAGAVGLRAGAAMDIPSSPVAPLLGHPPSEAMAAWAAEGDLVASGARAGITPLGLRPSAFAGFGVHGHRRFDGSPVTIPVWSYGAGVGVPVGERLSVDVEGRYRMPHQSDARLLPHDVRGGWEWRAGLSLHLGSTGAGPRPRVAGEGFPGTIRMGGRRTGGRSAVPAGGGRGERAGTRSASAAAVARDVIDTGDDHLGAPYVWGGESPGGFDCSGFVQYVFRRNGIRLPRVSRDQARAGVPVAPSVAALLPGDLMFYAGRDGVVNHVAIYAGGNRILHSSSSGRGVRYDDLSSRRGRYYATRMVAARRVIPEGGVFLLP